MVGLDLATGDQPTVDAIGQEKKDQRTASIILMKMETLSSKVGKKTKIICAITQFLMKIGYSFILMQVNKILRLIAKFLDAIASLGVGVSLSEIDC